MNTSEQTLLSLLRSSLFHTSEVTPNNTDWNKVLQEAQQQAVLGLVSDAIQEKVGPLHTDIYYGIISNSIRNFHAQSELVQLFSNAGIPIGILKGFAAAIYYPVPFNRTMGDIDFLVPRDRLEACKELMVNNGYIVCPHQDEINDRHIGYSKNGVKFELHYNFSQIGKEFDNFLTEGFECIETKCIDNRCFPVLPRLQNGMVLLAHMASHLKSGLGLRQVVDWMMFVDKEIDDVFWQSEFQETAKRFNLETLAISVTRMCQLHLGLSEKITWPSDADEKLCNRLLSTIMRSGNFGMKQGAGQKIETVSTEIQRRGLFRYLQYAGENNWKAYKKHRWLKPFCWAYQICRYFRQGISARRGKKMLLDVEQSKERYKVLKELNIV